MQARDTALLDDTEVTTTNPLGDLMVPEHVARAPKPDAALARKQEKRREIENAATKIQANFRGKQAMKKVEKKKEERKKAVIAATEDKEEGR